ncbi:MAG: rhodanese-like domain-containing protein, partial [Saprospiraceae bacterium]
MRSHGLLIFTLCLSFFQCTSQSKHTGMVKDAAFDQTIAALIDFSVKPISVSDAQKVPDAVYLDAREKEEFDISHIPGAHFIGYDHWSVDSLHNISKDQTLIVYCSVGYRSEKIGKKLEALGFTHVLNLYGSIFEWANEGNALESRSGKTNQIHTYNKKWSKW